MHVASACEGLFHTSGAALSAEPRLSQTRMTSSSPARAAASKSAS